MNVQIKMITKRLAAAAAIGNYCVDKHASHSSGLFIYIRLYIHTFQSHSQEIDEARGRFFRRWKR